jgi:hypothetical protein
MLDSNIFISSCSRRELARRKPPRNAFRVQLMLTMLLLVAATVALVAVRIGF